MSQDDRERDRLLTQVAKDCSYLVEQQRSQIQALVDHAHVDDMRFSNIDKTLNFQNKILYGVIGIVGFIEFMSKFIK